MALTLALALATPVWANLPVESLNAGGAEFRVLGQGRMRWFGLLLYDAALWTPGDRWRWDAPFALDLRYAREFQGVKLADASVDEMRRLGYLDDSKLARWRQAMVDAFPDVRKNDRITGVFRPGEGAEFFHNGRPTARIADPEFARAFFSIWLDPKTREPKLRAALTGQR